MPKQEETAFSETDLQAKECDQVTLFQAKPSSDGIMSSNLVILVLFAVFMQKSNIKSN